MNWSLILVITLLSLSLFAGSLNELGEQAHVDQELVFLFGVFDEKASKYEPSGRALENPVKFTINGYAKGSLPG